MKLMIRMSHVFSSIKENGLKSIYLRNIIFLIITLIIPTSLFLTIFYKTGVNKVEDEINNLYQTSINKTQERIDYEIKTINDLFYRLIALDSREDLSAISKIDTYNFETFEDLVDLNSEFDYILSSYRLVSSIDIFFCNSNSIVSSEKGIISYNDYENIDLIDNIMAGEKRQDYILYNNNLIFSTPISLFENSKYDIIFMKISISQLVSLLNIEDANISDNYIIDENGEVINKASLKDEDYLQAFTNYSLENKTSNEFENENFKIVFAKSNINHWTYAKILDISDYYKEINRYKNNFVTYIFISTIIIIIFAIFITQKISEPIDIFMSIVNRPTDWLRDNNKMQDLNFSELKYISNNLLASYSKNWALEEELDKRIAKLKEAQFVALQSQINPHFMYNTLDSINWAVLEKMGAHNPVSNIITSLSDFLRFSLQGDKNFVLIEDEVQNAKNYINIQQYRYDNKFNVIWENEKRSLKHKTIKIILQPLIENALFHGFNEEDGRFYIRVSVKSIDKKINIQVKDNGLGIDDKTLNEIKANFEKIENDIAFPTTQIGLYNVYQRIKLIFADDAEMSIFSSQGEGTSINISFPAIE